MNKQTQPSPLTKIKQKNKYHQHPLKNELARSYKNALLSFVYQNFKNLGCKHTYKQQKRNSNMNA
jgi:hypothetical protein